MGNFVDEVGVLDHLVGHVLHHFLGEIVLELFRLVLREAILDLSFASADVGHEVGGLLGNLLIVVGEIGAYVLSAAAAVFILGAGLGLFALGAGLRLGGDLGLGLRFDLGLWRGRLGRGRLRLLDHAGGGVP